MLTDKAYEDFQEYCMKRYGVSDIWAVYTKIQHEWLSQYMDLPEKHQSLLIGTLAHVEYINSMRRDVSLMNECYNKNADECKALREDSDGDIW